MGRSSEEFAERRQGWDQEPEKPRQVDLEEDGKERDKTVNTSWKGGSVAVEEVFLPEGQGPALLEGPCDPRPSAGSIFLHILQPQQILAAAFSKSN